MSNLKSVFEKAILFLLSVLVSSAPTAVSALSVPGGTSPGVATIETITLEEDLAASLLGSGDLAATQFDAMSLDPSADLSDDSFDFHAAAATLRSSIAIRTINPGYNLDAGKNSGELIELVNLTDGEVPLDFLALVYTAKPATGADYGKSTVLYRFPAGSKMVDRSILLRYKSAPEAVPDAQDLTYNTSLAMYGSLALVQTAASADFSSLPATSPLSDFGEVVQSVCWLGGEDCLPYFSTSVKSRSYTSIFRNDETGEYSHVSSVELLFSSAASGLYLPPEAESDISSGEGGSSGTSALITARDPQCAGLEFSEILSYYDADPSEQFIEIYNPTDSVVPLKGCQIRYKSKSYSLASSGENPASATDIPDTAAIGSSEYFVLYPSFRLTKNPTSENTLELIDVGGSIIDSLSYPHGQKKSASYALINYNADGSENWQITYAVTPGAVNVYQQYRSCEEGKIINETTGNCVKASTMDSTLKDCGEGKYRNPATGRCKSYSSDSSELTPCKEGYERNPETNRCRKIKENSGTDYPVVPVTGVEEQSTFIALWALAGVAALGVVYIIFQFRREIKFGLKKLLGKFRH